MLAHNKNNGNSTSRKKKISTCSFDVCSDKSIASSRSLSPFKQRSITPPPKNQYEFNNLPLITKSEYFLKVFIVIFYQSDFLFVPILCIPGCRSRSIDGNFKKNEQLAENESDKQNGKNMQNSNFDRMRKLMSPFKKPPFYYKLTSNRRRWSHVFPQSISKQQ